MTPTIAKAAKQPIAIPTTAPADRSEDEEEEEDEEGEGQKGELYVAWGLDWRQRATHENLFAETLTKYEVEWQISSEMVPLKLLLFR